jgi:hypothetical protein
MRNTLSFITISAACVIALAAIPAPAQQKAGGTLVCWKDKTGKTIGCGDKIPPEYQENASSTLNTRGVTINQSEAPPTAEQKQAQKNEAERKQLEDQKREDEKRRDRALLDSFTNEKEIDLKRARDIQQIEVNISAHQANLKSSSDRETVVNASMDRLKKENKPVPAAMQQEYEKLTAEMAKTQDQIKQKRREIADKTQEFDAMKRRFIELRSTAPAKK